MQTVKGILALDADIYMPGHGELQTKADVQERFAAVEARRDEIKLMVSQLSLDLVKQALGENGSAPRYDLSQFPDSTTVVYTEFTKKP